MSFPHWPLKSPRSDGSRRHVQETIFSHYWILCSFKSCLYRKLSPHAFKMVICFYVEHDSISFRDPSYNSKLNWGASNLAGLNLGEGAIISTADNDGLNFLFHWWSFGWWVEQVVVEMVCTYFPCASPIKVYNNKIEKKKSIEFFLVKPHAGKKRYIEYK